MEKENKIKTKTFIVTGASSGIGRITALEIAKLGAKVIMVCRNELKGKAVQDDINATTGLHNCDLMICDFSSQQSIKKFATEFNKKYKKLDVLINNAGVIEGTKKMTVDGFEWMFGTNHLGYFLTTHYLLPSLQKAENARIVNVASVGHWMAKLDFDNLQSEKKFNSFSQYCTTKLCNILFTRKLAKELAHTNITVNCLHPGNINSNFGQTGTPFFKFILKQFGETVLASTNKGAETSIYLATSDDVENISGIYFDNKKSGFCTATSKDMQKADLLWQKSLELTKIKDYFG